MHRGYTEPRTFKERNPLPLPLKIIIPSPPPRPILPALAAPRGARDPRPAFIPAAAALLIIAAIVLRRPGKLRLQCDIGLNRRREHRLRQLDLFPHKPLFALLRHLCFLPLLPLTQGILIPVLRLADGCPAPPRFQLQADGRHMLMATPLDEPLLAHALFFKRLALARVHGIEPLELARDLNPLKVVPVLQGRPLHHLTMGNILLPLPEREITPHIPVPLHPGDHQPRVVTGPILLTDIATCATCGGGMTLRTGKSGKYRYYTCATCAQQGKSACPGRSIPMDKLDTLVTDKLNGSLFKPERIRALLTGLLARQSARSDDHSQRVAALQNRLAECETRLSRLYEAIENGIADSTDPTLKDRLATLKNERDRAKAARDRAMQELQPETRITEEKINAFADLMRENVANGPIPFRRAYIRAVVDQVEVDDAEIRIHGRKDVLERLVMANGAIPAGVPSFVRKWRTRQDSNL